MNKAIVSSLFALIIFILPLVINAEEIPPKIGVMFSHPNEQYAKITSPGGKYKPPYMNEETVYPKVSYSSIYDKELKYYHFLKQQGYNVQKVSHDALNSLELLHQYDAIVFPYTTLMNHQQRENLKRYIYGGGGALFIYGTGRNELDYMPKNGQMDLTPLIFHTISYIWEWDNLTEVFQSRFITDNHLKNVVISNNPDVTHPILTEAYKKLGRNYIQISENRSDGYWYEIMEPWNSNIKPLLVISDFSYASQPEYMKKGKTGAMFALEYGKGRVVVIPFKMFDFLHVEANDKWEDNTRGLAWDKTYGHEDAAALTNSSVNWVIQRASSNAFKRLYDVQLTTSNISAYVTPQKKFAIRGTVKTSNGGNVPVRGYLKVQVLDQNNKVLGEYKRVLPGLAPKGAEDSSFTEKFEILLPGNLANGNYTLYITFEDTRHDRKGFITRAERFTITKKGNSGTLSSFKMFSDVPMNSSHYKHISDAAKIGIITGYGNGKFMPASNVSRLNAMMMLLRALDIKPTSTATMPASDMKKGQYGYDVMATAYQRGFITLENGKANPQAPIRRGVMAQALTKAFQLQGKSDLPFTDISPSYEQYKNIEVLYHHEITTGTTPTTFDPYAPVTRQQFATFIMRSLNASSK